MTTLHPRVDALETLRGSAEAVKRAEWQNVSLNGQRVNVTMECSISMPSSPDDKSTDLNGRLESVTTRVLPYYLNSCVETLERSLKLLQEGRSADWTCAMVLPERSERRSRRGRRKNMTRTKTSQSEG